MTELKKLTQYNVLLSILLISGFFSVYMTIGHQAAQVVRLFVPVCTLWIIQKQRLVVNRLDFLVIVFFSIFFSLTTITSLINFRETDIADYLNFLIVCCFSVILLLFSKQNTKSFLTILFNLTVLFLILSLIVALYESITLNHLAFSKNFNIPKEKWWEHAPTGFQYNQNDLAASFTLMCLFVITYLRYYSSQSRLWFELIVISANLWIAFATGARLIQITSFIIIIMLFFKYVFKLKYIMLFALIILISLILFQDYWHKIALQIEKTVEGGFFTASERFNLYRYGVLSIMDSKGMGFGIRNCDAYYLTIPNRLELFGTVLIPHSYWIEILMTAGILALIAWFIMYFEMIRKEVQKGYRVGVISFFVIYPIVLLCSSSSMFSFPIYIYFIAFIVLINNRTVKNG